MQNEKKDCKDPIQLLLAPYAKYGEQLNNPEKCSIWLLEQYDQWFTKTSRVLFGVFTSREKALASLGYGTDKWEQDEFYQNGSSGNQWLSDILNCGYIVNEVELDKFEEL